MEGAIQEQDQAVKNLPPGFRFYPTDEEIIIFYLMPKLTCWNFAPAAIGEVDLNKVEPWDLPSQAKMGEKEWWFFCQRDKKYSTGTRTNRATEEGYWKATGKDKEIFRGKNMLIGMKKTLVFYIGRAPRGKKTHWVMHEFRLESRLPVSDITKPMNDNWAVCKVYKKPGGVPKRDPIEPGLERINSFVDGLLNPSTLSPLQSFDQSFYNRNICSVNFDAEPVSSTSFMPYEDPIPKGYVFNQDPIRMYCKAEKSIPSLSHETSQSELVDRNKEISSVVTMSQNEVSKLATSRSVWPNNIWI